MMCLFSFALIYLLFIIVIVVSAWAQSVSCRRFQDVLTWALHLHPTPLANYAQLINKHPYVTAISCVTQLTTPHQIQHTTD